MFKGKFKILVVSIALGFMIWSGMKIVDGVGVEIVDRANAASLKVLGCHESLYFNDRCTDDIYMYCDSTGDGRYDSYYFLGVKGLGFTPYRLYMTPEESMEFYRKIVNFKCEEETLYDEENS